MNAAETSALGHPLQILERLRDILGEELMTVHLLEVLSVEDRRVEARGHGCFDPLTYRL